MRSVAGGWKHSGNWSLIKEIAYVLPALSPEQEAEAQRIFQILKQTSDQDLMALARLLASKPDHELLGKTEFEVRDRVHRIGAKAIETALDERKKGHVRGSRTGRRPCR